MNDDFRAALDDLVVEVPRHVVPDSLTEASWATGRRRRRRGLVVRGAAAFVAMLAVGALVLTTVSALRPIAPASGGSGAGVDGYPERIGHQWVVHDLPDAPGPMAGLLLSGGTDPITYQWYAFSEGGTRWRLPAETEGLNNPVISPDGLHVGYLKSRFGPYVMRDLQTGTRATFPRIGGPTGDATQHYLVFSQNPGFWSPDGRHLLLWGSPRAADDIVYLLLGADGSLAPLKVRGYIAGWLSDNTFAVVSPAGASGDPNHRAVLKTVNTQGDVLASELIPVPRPPAHGQLSSATLSPNGRQLAVITSRSRPDTAHCCASVVTIDRLYRYSLTTGQVSSHPFDDDLLNNYCPAVWRNGAPVSATQNQITVVYPGVHSSCIIWAADAPIGSPHGNIFGLSDTWLAWWWRETLAGALLGLLVVAGVVWLIRRRRRGGWPSDDEYRSLRPDNLG